MIQIASVLAVATVFISLWILISRQRGGGLICKAKIHMQELEPKVQGGGLICEGV